MGKQENEKLVEDLKTLFARSAGEGGDGQELLRRLVAGPHVAAFSDGVGATLNTMLEEFKATGRATFDSAAILDAMAAAMAAIYLGLAQPLLKKNAGPGAVHALFSIYLDSATALFINAAELAGQAQKAGVGVGDIMRRRADEALGKQPIN